MRAAPVFDRHPFAVMSPDVTAKCDAPAHDEHDDPFSFASVEPPPTDPSKKPKKTKAKKTSKSSSSKKHDPWSSVDDLSGTKLYELLDIPFDATADEIKRAWRENARKNHPDKGGCAEKFAEIQKAFETLSDPNRKAAYDLLASEHEYRYIPGVTPRARGGEDVLLDDLERLGLKLDPGSQLVVLCEVCGRPSNKECFACGLKFCDFCTRKLHWKGGVGLHYPVSNAPGHLRSKLAEKELEKKIEEDSKARLMSDPNYRHDVELAEIRRFKEICAERDSRFGIASNASQMGGRVTLTKTFDRRLGRYYMWCQTARKVYISVYVPTGYADKELRVEVVPDGSGGGKYYGNGEYSGSNSYSTNSGIGGVVVVQPEDSPPVIERLLDSQIDGSCPVETVRSKDGRRCAIALVKARPGQTWTKLFSGDPTFARCLKQPYQVHETNDDVTVTFNELPFWIRSDDVTCDVDPYGLSVRIQSSELELVRRTFWRSDDAEAGEAEQSEQSENGPLSIGDTLDDPSSEERTEKKKKHVDFLLYESAAWSLDRGTGETNNSLENKNTATEDDVTLTIVVDKRLPTKQETQFKKGIVQDNRHDSRVFNPGRAIGARLFTEDQDDFFLEDDLTALSFFETGETWRPAKPWVKYWGADPSSSPGKGSNLEPERDVVVTQPSQLSQSARVVLEQLIVMDEREDEGGGE